MLPIHFLRQERERVLQSFAKRNNPNSSIVDEIIALDDQRKSFQTQLDQTLARGNQLAKEIGALMKKGDTAQAETAKKEAAQLREDAKTQEESLRQAQEQIYTLSLQVPNCLQERVPAGKDADDNEVYKDWTAPMPKLHEGALPHWELAKKYQLFDFELGAKVTGAGFPFYMGKGAKLQRALISFFLDEAIAAGYMEYIPPLVVNADSARGTGQLPDKDAQMYYIERDELYMIPTSEVPLTNIFRDVILDANQLPAKLTAYTPCFRREAGSYGAHVRGLNRLHQFDKVEIVRVELPENSNAALEEMSAHVASLLAKLELPYRILRLCGGDTGFASAHTYDFETFCVAQNRWLEVSSVSNFEVFQANRLNLRYRNPQTKKTEILHTLNGSALALPRIVATILENHQTPEGVRIPAALQPYTGFDMIK